MDITEFVEELLNVELTEFQKVAIKSFAESNEVKPKTKSTLPLPYPVPSTERIKMEWGL